jgi:hypothetical protein
VLGGLPLKCEIGFVSDALTPGAHQYRDDDGCERETNSSDHEKHLYGSVGSVVVPLTTGYFPW